jgi:hypothetical protein
MSRRHHGGRPHRQNAHARGTGPIAPAQASPRHASPQASPTAPPLPVEAAPPDAAPTEADEAASAVDATPHASPPVDQPQGDQPRRPFDRGPNGHETSSAPARQPLPGPDPAAAANGSAGCTAPQLRRFIKSRPYVPMHELRRRFGINGTEDDMTLVEVDGGRVFVGLPAREGGLLGELLRGGEVGYELSLDPRSPVVVGLYPMRPVPRS